MLLTITITMTDVCFRVCVSMGCVCCACFYVCVCVCDGSEGAWSIIHEHIFSLKSHLKHPRPEMRAYHITNYHRYEVL